MRTLVLIFALTACDGGEPTDTDPADTSDTDTDTDTGDVEPAVDLAGRWVVPFTQHLPGQADRFWCADAEPGDYNDETWYELGEPVECFDEGTAGGCHQDLEFLADGSAKRHIRYGANGPCPFDGQDHSVVGWEDYGAWELVSTDGQTDTYDVNGMTWTVYELGDGRSVVVEGEGVTVTLVPGQFEWAT